MFWIWLALMIAISMVLIFLALIYAKQGKLDLPLSGVLIVDESDPDSQALVYFQTKLDPALYKDGEVIKVRVRKFQSRNKTTP